MDKEESLLTLAGADNTLANMPGSPELQMMRAQALNRGVQNGWTVNDSGEPLELDAWQHATLLRPAWPYSWSSIRCLDIARVSYSDGCLLSGFII